MAVIFRSQDQEGIGFAESLLFLRKCSGVAVVAGEVFVGSVDVEEVMAFRIELIQFSAVSLGQDGVARVAVAGCDLLRAISRLVIFIMATEAAWPFLVARIVRIGPPVHFHLREEAFLVNVLCGGDGGVDLRRARILGFQCRGDFFDAL